MWKKGLLANCCIFISVVVSYATPLPWAERLNEASRYQTNSSGILKIGKEQTENAIRFDHVANPGQNGDGWIYPLFALRPEESLTMAKTLSFEIKVSDQEAKCALVILNPGDIHLPYRIQGNDWQKITLDLVATKVDLSKIKMIAIGLNPKHAKFTFWLRSITLDDGIRLPDASSGIIMANDVGGTYWSGKIPTFSLEAEHASPRKYRLMDYRGNILRQGEWPENGKGKLSIEGLSRGYYMLAADGLESYRGFAIVPDPDIRKVNPDSFFALGSISAWGSRAEEHPKNKRRPSNAPEICAELLRIAGIPLVREFNTWKVNQPYPDKYAFPAFVDHTAKLLKVRNIKMATFFEGAPDFMRRDRPSFFPRFPDDLVGTFDFSLKLAEHHRGKIDIMEYFNEPDIGSWPEPVWDFAAAAKAASLGFRAGNPNVTVLNGAFAYTPPGPYGQAVLDNDLAAYFDVFNVHTYSNPGRVDWEFSELLSFMKHNGLENMPIYVTETGTNLEGNGQIDSWVPGLKEHSAQQAMLCAEILPKLYIKLQSNGAAKAFFFCLIPKNEREGKKVWGMLGYDFTVKPSFVALSTLTNELGNAEYQGKLHVGKEIQAYLYKQPNGSQRLAFWSNSEVDASQLKDTLPQNVQKKMHLQHGQIQVANGRYSGVDFLGAPIHANAVDGIIKLEATRFPQYLHGLSGLLPNDPAHKIGSPGPLKTNRDLTVIMKTRLSSDFSLYPEKDAFDLLSDTPASFQLEIHNLDTAEKQGTVSCSGATIIGLPDSVIVPPRSWIKLDLKMIPPKSNDTAIVFSGTFNSRPITRLAMKCRLSKSWKRQVLFSTDKAQDWTPSCGGTMTITNDAAEDALRFEAKLPNPKNRWVYPGHIIAPGFMKNVFAVEFEIKIDNIPQIPKTALMMLSANGHTHHYRYTPVIGKWSKCMIVVKNRRSDEQGGEKIDPSKVDRISIGMNPDTEKITYWVRNIRVVFCPDKKMNGSE